MEQIPWDVKESRLVYANPPWLRMWEQDVLLPTGTMIQDYLVMERREAALVFAVTEDDDVIMIEQYRHGIGTVELGLPAGFMDEADTSPLVCAMRELAEETGYESTDWTFLGDFAIDPNRSPARYSYFMARNCRRTTVRQLEPAEVGTVLHYVPLERLLAWRNWRQANKPNLPTVTGLTLGLLEVVR